VKKIKVGDLVKLKPDAAEGNAKSLGIGLIIEEGKDDWNKQFVYIQWLKGNGKPWFRYKDEVELVSEGERSTINR
tara:strand:+ start:235 stop:459 length:225 start_codon:yes stop_codon:yes gene_type:complete